MKMKCFIWFKTGTDMRGGGERVEILIQQVWFCSAGGSFRKKNELKSR